MAEQTSQEKTQLHRDVKHRLLVENSIINHAKIKSKSAQLATCKRGTGQLKYDGTRAEARFRISAKRASASKSAGESVQSTTGSRGVRITVTYAGHTNVPR